MLPETQANWTSLPMTLSILSIKALANDRSSYEPIKMLFVELHIEAEPDMAVKISAERTCKLHMLDA